MGGREGVKWRGGGEETWVRYSREQKVESSFRDTVNVRWDRSNGRTMKMEECCRKCDNWWTD